MSRSLAGQAASAFGPRRQGGEEPENLNALSQRHCARDKAESEAVSGDGSFATVGRHAAGECSLRWTRTSLSRRASESLPVQVTVQPARPQAAQCFGGRGRCVPVTPTLPLGT
eukprot:917208-Rhodomonas_salina.1